MRVHTVSERELLRGDFGLFVRLEVEDPDGQWRDLSDRFVSARWSETLDAPVRTGQVVLQLEDRSDGVAGNLSLAPFMETSTMNRDGGGAYAPLLDAARLVRLFVACVVLGSAPTVGNWREMWVGVIDNVSVAEPHVTLQWRDLGARLAGPGGVIETEQEYGSEEGTLVEEVMQQILDDTVGAGTVTLATQDSPLWFIHPYTQARVYALDATRALALQIGHDVRYKYDAGPNGGVFRLTFYEPERSKTTPDTSFGPTEYVDPRQLDIADAAVRNVVRVYYTDAATGERAFEERTDPDSIARFGRRYMEIAEDATSNIDSAAEAGALADAALADLAAPEAEQAIQTLFFWPAELGDLYALEPNGVQYDTEQRFAVTRLDWELSGGSGKTTFAVRGKPAGAYKRWLKLGRAFAAGPYLMRAADPEGMMLPVEATDAGGRAVEETGARVEDTITPGRDLAEGVGQQNAPGSAVPLVRGYQYGTCRDGDTVVFPAAFAAAPGVIVLPGNVAGPGATPLDYQLLATEILNTQFKALGRYVNPGVPTARVAQFDGVRCDAVGEDTIATLPAFGADTIVGGRLDLNFRVHLFADAQLHINPNPPNYMSIRVVLAFEVNHNGGGWAERTTRSYFLDNRSDESAATLHLENEDATVIDVALDSGDQVRIKIKSIEKIGLGVASCYVEGYDGVDDPTAGGTADGVEFSTTAGESYVTMTPTADHFLTWIAFEVGS